MTNEQKELVLEKLKNHGFKIRYTSLSDGIKFNNLVYYQPRRKVAAYILFNIFDRSGEISNSNKRYVIDIPFELSEIFIK